MFTCTIKRSYSELRSLYIGVDGRKHSNYRTGKVTVFLANDAGFSIEGTLNSAGYLSGMAKLYKKLNLLEGTEVKYSILEDGSIKILSPEIAPEPVITRGSTEIKTVFQAKQLKHIHIEPFRPESLNTWEPETETDIYLAFGVLQQFTDYQYCCGASKALLTKLGALYDDSSRPDAILISRITDEYMMAEWKKYSSDFKLNHKADDVDVLVCWLDDELDRPSLPRTVLALHNVAKVAATTAIDDA